MQVIQCIGVKEKSRDLNRCYIHKVQVWCEGIVSDMKGYWWREEALFRPLYLDFHVHMIISCEFMCFSGATQRAELLLNTLSPPEIPDAP